MRWLAVWLVLTGVFFAGQIVAPLFSGGAIGSTWENRWENTWEYTQEDLAHLATIPLVQLAAILDRRPGAAAQSGPALPRSYASPAGS